MPWQETDVREERIRFVVAARQGETPFAGLCRRFGVSRKTGYKWLRRYEEVGSLSALEEESRRPCASPNQTELAIEEQVVSLRSRYGWGSRKLQVLLSREGVKLGRATIDRILKRRGMVTEGACSRPAVKRFERATPNELVQMDFKGQYAIGQAGACYPLSLIDDHSRYLLALAPQRSTEGDGAELVARATFEQFGVPEWMLIDHGTPWWSSTNGHGLTRFSVFLIKQGVRLTFSGIAHPQTQGKVERLHRSLNQWFQHHGLPKSFDGFARELAAFREEYNHVRPHEAIALKVPAEVYRPSPRPYQPNPSAWEYPPGTRVRQLADNGCLYLDRYYFVCHALAGEEVRCDHFDDRILVSYRHMLIREIDCSSGATRTIVKPYGPTGHQPAKVLPMS